MVCPRSSWASPSSSIGKLVRNKIDDSFPTSHALPTALSTLGACAVRIPHYHANTHEMLYVTAGTIAFVNVEANNTFTKGEASAGFLVEQPRGVLHVVYNPTCQNSTYNIFYAAANVTTYNVPYGINNVGNFSIDATYGKQYTYIDTRNSAFSRWYPDPALRYPNSADKGLWTYNPECVQRCGLKLPSTLIDIEKQPQAIKIGG